jgi:hypothetical protein
VCSSDLNLKSIINNSVDWLELSYSYLEGKNLAVLAPFLNALGESIKAAKDIMESIIRRLDQEERENSGYIQFGVCMVVNVLLSDDDASDMTKVKDQVQIAFNNLTMTTAGLAGLHTLEKEKVAKYSIAMAVCLSASPMIANTIKSINHIEDCLRAIEAQSRDGQCWLSDAIETNFGYILAKCPYTLVWSGIGSGWENEECVPLGQCSFNEVFKSIEESIDQKPRVIIICMKHGSRTAAERVWDKTPVPIVVSMNTSLLDTREPFFIQFLHSLHERLVI